MLAILITPNKMAEEEPKAAETKPDEKKKHLGIPEAVFLVCLLYNASSSTV